MSRAHLILHAILLAQTFLSNETNGVIVSLDPKATYLRTNSDPNAKPATPFSLDSIGASPGIAVRLERLGFYKPAAALQENGRFLIGVFSSDATLLPADSDHRVRGALEAGTDFNTANTFFGGLPTNIDEDFGSLKKSVGKFWFRKFTEHMVERNFSRFVGAKTV